MNYKSKPFTVGLTGGFASGKSTVACRFKSLGAIVIEADAVARKIMDQDVILIDRIVAHFGSEYRTKHGSLDRSRLRKLIFDQAIAREWVEQLIHPLVYEAIRHQLKQVKDNQYVVLVLPILFERPPPLKIDQVLVVATSERNQTQYGLARAKQHSDVLIESQIRAILQAQWPLDRKIAQADSVIMNDKDLDYLYQQVDLNHQAYQSLSGLT